MNARFDSSSASSSHQSTLLRMRDVVKRFNVSPTTIRRSTSNGELACLTLPSGHRRFRLEDVQKWLGFGSENNIGKDGLIPIAAVIRVSTAKQNRAVGKSEKSSLDHQKDRVLNYIDERWGDSARTSLYSSIGSGLNFERKNFLKLVADILEGKYKGGYVVATDFTRICRFGIKLVEFIAEKGECQIAYTMKQEDKDSGELDWTADLLGVITHFSAKNSGLKNRAINQVKLTEEQLEEAYRFYKEEGISYRAICEEFKKKGWGEDAKGRKISRYVIQARLTEKRAVLEKLYCKNTGKKNSFVLFVELFVKKSKNDKTRLSRKRLLEAYQDWCKDQEFSVLSSKRISKFTQEYGWQKKLNAKSSVNFVGLSLLNINKERS